MKTASFPKRRSFYVLLVLVLVIAGGLSWYLRRAATNIQNVILISIDTCRADHLSCYGFERQTTPHIDEIAGQGIIYKKARTPVPLTLPAHCSMLTGTFPPYHRVHDNISNKLDESHLTLAEILQENGFATGAVVSSIVLQNKFGVGQGFNVFQDQFDTVTDSYSLVERRGGQASQLAGDFLTSHQNEPFFLFLHYFDPHDAYEPPEPFSSIYADDLYSGEIAYTDHCIGQVIDQLKDLELYDSTLIIIVGDHGEALGEHGETTHGYYIYQSTIHVPFIIRAPGIDQPKEVEQTVSLVDVAPTILGYLDIPAPAHMQGEDLSDYSRKRNQVDSDREVYTESLIPTKFGCNPFLGVVNDRWSYIYTNHTELYDLQQDPQELYNLASEQIQTVRLLNSHLEEMVAQLPGAAFPDNVLEMDLESLRQLESLGYVGDATVNNLLVIDESKKDPRQMQLYYEHREKAGILYGKKEYEAARAVCLKMLSEWPEVTASYFLMTEITYKTRNPAEVIKYGRQYLARKTKEIEAGNLTVPTSLFTRTYDMMLLCAYDLENYELVVEFGRRQLQLNPNNPVVMDILATAYFRLGQHQQAFDIWEELLRIKPDMAEAYGNLGKAHFQLGEMEEAIANWSQALQLRPDWPQLRNDLNEAIRLSQLNQSIAQLTEALQQEPNNFDIRNDLAQAYYLKGDYERAIKYWREALQLKPDGPEVHNSMGQAYYMLRQLDKAQEHWRRAVQLKPDWPEACNSLAWLLATSPEPELLRPAEALELALRAAELSQYENTSVLETLGVAYAVNNKIDEAISTAQKAIQLANTAGNLILAEKFRKYIQKFRDKRDGQS